MSDVRPGNSGLSVVPIETSLTVRGVTVKIVLDPVNQWLEIHTDDTGHPKYGRDMSVEFREADVEAMHDAV